MREYLLGRYAVLSFAVIRTVILQTGVRQRYIATTLRDIRKTAGRRTTPSRQTGTANDRPGTGCLYVTNPHVNSHIRFIHQQNRFVTATAATALGLQVI